MTFSVLTNIATMILCVAVLIQTVRLMRALDKVKGGALTDVVGALDASTGEARRVLVQLTELLRGDVAANARTLSEGKSMIEELAIMTGIANAIAERIVEAAGASHRPATTPKRAKAGAVSQPLVSERASTSSQSAGELVDQPLRRQSRGSARAATAVA